MLEKSVWLREEEEWKKISDVPNECPRYDMSYCRVSDGFVAIGGCSVESASAQCHHFSLSSRQWRRMQDLQTTRFLSATVLLEDDEVFVFGGEAEDDDGEGILLSSCEKLSVQANTWTSIRDLPEPLSRPLVTAANGKAYIIPRGRSVPADNRLQLVEYDPIHDRYSAQSKLPESVTGTGDAHLTGKADQLYLFQSEPNWENSIYHHNLSNGQWSKIVVKKPPFLVSHVGGTTPGNLIWCGTDKLYEYCRDTHQWIILDYKLPCYHFFTKGFLTVV